MRTEYIAIGIAAVMSLIPASFAQGSRVLAHGKSAGTGTDGGKRQANEMPLDNTGISLAVPVGKVWVGPESLEGEPSYVRRTTVKEGMTIVEVSTTPFVPERPGVAVAVVRPDQPASW